MNAGRTGRLIRVSGRVQGVGFRAGTAERARALDLKGYVRNLADGRVEVLACGGESQIQELIAWLHSGPPAARVTGVHIQDSAGEETASQFMIR